MKNPQNNFMYECFSFQNFQANATIIFTQDIKIFISANVKKKNMKTDKKVNVALETLFGFLEMNAKFINLDTINFGRCFGCIKHGLYLHTLK